MFILGNVGCKHAIPALKDKWKLFNSDVKKTPPDWTGPVRCRKALRKLGALPDSRPEEYIHLINSDKNLGDVVENNKLKKAIEILADNNRLILYVQLWKHDPKHGYIFSQKNNLKSIEFNFQEPWGKLVDQSKMFHLALADDINENKKLVCTIEFIASDDIGFSNHDPS